MLINNISIISFSNIREIQINKEEGDKLLSTIYLILKIVKTLLYSFEDVIGKVIFLYHNFTVYSLLLIKSIIQIIFSIVFSFPFIFIKFKDEVNNERTLFSMIGDIFENKMNILIYFFLLSSTFFIALLYGKLLKNFPPTIYGWRKFLKDWDY